MRFWISRSEHPFHNFLFRRDSCPNLPRKKIEFQEKVWKLPSIRIFSNISFPANIYLFKVAIEILKKGVKYVQS